MTYLVTPGREISINGKRILSGQEVKNLDKVIAETLINDGILVSKIEVVPESVGQVHRMRR